MTRGAARLLVALWAGAVVAPLTVDAQRVRLTLSGFPLQVTTTTGADFDAGSVALGSMSFTVDMTLGVPLTATATTVSVSCDAPCPQSGSLSLAALQWRRADLATWNTLTTSPTLVETRSVTFLGANDPWSNTVAWRYLLTWTANPPAAATRWRIRFQLTTSAP